MEEENKEINEEEKVVYQDTKSNDKKLGSKQLIILYVVFTILISSVCSVIAIKITQNSIGSKPVVVYKAVDTSASATMKEMDLSELIKTIRSTVVEVYTEQAAYNTFFGDYITEGAGSGVIYTSDGYIITNNHVIEGATTIKVKLFDGKEYDAELIASDALTDVAVLKIEETDLQAVILGNSGNLEVGENCIVIGNPLGTLGGTVTTGIISALSREITVDNIPMTLLQTNAAISPGNSGGGMFNTNGELIGIVNAKSSGENIEGIGFAIPVDNVKEIAEQLIENGYVIGRAQLGIKCVSIDSIQQAWNYGVNSLGVYVAEVIEESTKKAGLEVGDVIVGINDQEINNYNELQAALFKYSAGDTIQLKVIRGRNEVIVSIKLVQKK